MLMPQLPDIQTKRAGSRAHSEAEGQAERVDTETVV
jgi:hypothetical protein